jgi:hypothetical protein
MDGVGIILNNTGDNIYAQSARDFLINPIKVRKMRFFLTDGSLVMNIVQIRNSKSIGAQWNRDISLQNYIDVIKNSTNMIIDIPLDPPLIIDGQTYINVMLPSASEMDIMFYYLQTDVIKATS